MANQNYWSVILIFDRLNRLMHCLRMCRRRDPTRLQMFAFFAASIKPHFNSASSETPHQFASEPLHPRDRLKLPQPIACRFLN
jgi:hypothetical protein